MANTLKNTKWTVTHNSNGSRGQLTLNDNTTGVFKVGPAQSNVTWCEKWDGNHCYLWVIFDDQIEKNNVRIWGMQTTTEEGYGMSAFGNSNPGDQDNTTFVNDFLTMQKQ
ncbi:MAG: hypothetical protein NXI08_09700 [bacterium]|nr:hypothetical protein [bacterium]